MKRKIYLILSLALLVIIGCSEPSIINFIAPIEGDLKIGFVNETPYSVSTYWGVYNPLDPKTNFNIDLVELGPGENNLDNFSTLLTARRLDIAGVDLRKAAQIAAPAGIDPSKIQDVITFTKTDNTTQGTAPAARIELGNDYIGNDYIEIHFKQVPGTEDQFKVEIDATPPP